MGKWSFVRSAPEYDAGQLQLLSVRASEDFNSLKDILPKLSADFTRLSDSIDNLQRQLDLTSGEDRELIKTKLSRLQAFYQQASPAVILLSKIEGEIAMHLSGFEHPNHRQPLDEVSSFAPLYLGGAGASSPGSGPPALKALKALKAQEAKNLLKATMHNPHLDELKQVAVDIDSTIFRLWEALSAVAGRKIDINECKEWNDIIPLCGGIEEFKRILPQALALDGAMQGGLFEGVRDTARELRNYGVKIHLMTHRDPKLRKDTEVFLQLLGFPYDKLDIDFDFDKTALCKEREIPVIIDDKPDTLKTAHQAGLKVFGLSFPYNQEFLKSLGQDQTEGWGADIGPQVFEALGALVEDKLENLKAVETRDEDIERARDSITPFG